MKPGRSVGLFIPHLGIGGAELQLGLLAPRLAASGWTPLVLTMEDLHGTASRLVDAGVEVAFLPRAGRAGLDTIGALAKTVRARRLDVLHAWLFASNWRAAVARVLASETRVVASIRSMEDDLGPRHLAAYRLLSPWIDRVVVNSAAVLDRSAGRTGIPREKYRLVRNAVELERLDRESREPIALPWDPDRPPVVGWVGTLHARKRAGSIPSIAARVLARVPSARFLVVGDGPERRSVEEGCARLGLSDRFELAGYQARVGSYLKRMSVLIHPSMNEGSSNAILEAMAAAVPVVAYAVSGNVEMVVSGETGVLVPDASEEELASAAVGLLLDPSRARRLGDAARAKIERDYSVEAMVRGTTAIYGEVRSLT